MAGDGHLMWGRRGLRRMEVRKFPTHSETARMDGRPLV
jgi:hypothetical protein